MFSLTGMAGVENRPAGGEREKGKKPKTGKIKRKGMVPMEKFVLPTYKAPYFEALGLADAPDAKLV